jgi:hypothetical protein
MDYVLLIYEAEDRLEKQSAEARRALMGEYVGFTRELAATGRMGDSAPLEPTRTATSVRVRDGKRVVTDGPFAETREQLGGYYVVSAESEEEALAWAAKIPSARVGSIEVRPASSIAAAPPGGTEVDTKLKEYLLFIYEPESYLTSLADDARKAVFGRYVDLTKSLRTAKAYVEGSPLQSVTKAKTVRVREGKRVVTDGPFAETREQLAGYYRVRAGNLDQALDYAARIPAAESGTIEVRPVLDLGSGG